MKKILTSSFSLLFVIFSFNSAFADIVSSDNVVKIQQQQFTRQQIISYMDTAAVQQKLEQLGVSREQAMARVQHMTDEELHQFHNSLEQLPAGEGVVGTIVTVLVVIAVLDVLGVTDVYPFIRPINS